MLAGEDIGKLDYLGEKTFANGLQIKHGNWIFQREKILAVFFPSMFSAIAMV